MDILHRKVIVKTEEKEWVGKAVHIFEKDKVLDTELVSKYFPSNNKEYLEYVAQPSNVHRIVVLKYDGRYQVVPLDWVSLVH